MSILTKALIFKPKKLKDGWEHKNGFYVSIDAKSALVIIDKARDKRKYSKFNKQNIYNDIDNDSLRSKAESRLYEIESSSNNYIEFICAVGGVFVFIYLTGLIVKIWNYPSQTTVRLFLILVLILGGLVYLYFKKEKIVNYIVEDFLDLEDALYFQEYGRSQYLYRR